MSLKRLCLIIILLFQISFVFPQAALKITNFSQSGASVTFDIEMANEQAVQAIQFDLMSGDGIYDEGDDCQCTFSGSGAAQQGALPSGCTECYYDNGPDFVSNQFETGYYQSADSDAGTNGCEVSGICTSNSFTNATDCEEAGQCSNGYNSTTDYCFINGVIYSQFTDDATCGIAGLDGDGNLCTDSATNSACTALGDWREYRSSDCADVGVCSDTSYTTITDCYWNGGTWTANEIWYPENLWIAYDTPDMCQAASDPVTGLNYQWLSADQDASGDDYRVFVDPTSNSSGWSQTNFQFCRVPGVFSYDPGSTTTYYEYNGLANPENYGLAGHCSQVDSYCRDLSVCSGESAGLACNNGFPNSDVCNSSTNPDWSWISPHRYYKECVDNGFAWTAYNTQSVCEDNGGIWVGSESGSEGNDEYDLGENFYESEQVFSISSVSDYPSTWFNISGSSTVQLFNVGGSGNIDPSQSFVKLMTVSGTFSSSSDVTDVAYLFSRSICARGDNFQCMSELILSDTDGEEIDVTFIPFYWSTLNETGLSLDDSSSSSDGVCSYHVGETYEDDSSCTSICGDGYCHDSSLGGTESYGTCKGDCPDPVDGDGYCDYWSGEDHINNPSDCTAFGCGDYACVSGEDSSNCSWDCLSYCGDGSCDSSDGENGSNCSDDCGNYTINDGQCDLSEGENYCNSAADCVNDSVCGDGCYHHVGIGGTEDDSCADYEIACGDNVYHYDGLEVNSIEANSTTGETYETCPGDYIQTCEDGYYDHIGTSTGGTETDYCADGTTPNPDYVSTLGDGVCDSSENPGTDAACPSACGDGFYHHANLSVAGTESIDATFCQADYPEVYLVPSSASPASGDGVCDGRNSLKTSGFPAESPDGNGENYYTSPADCASACGDGYCHDSIVGGSEDAASCPTDCGVTSCNNDGVCVSYSDGTVSAPEDNISCPGDCDVFTLCGDGTCQSFLSETAGTTAAGTCDQDCAAEDDSCTFGEGDSANSWYNYNDCASCGDGTCQEGFGETATYGGTGFCYADCWVSCGDGVCDGPENTSNCYGDGIYDETDGSWSLDPTADGDCLSIVENNVPLDYMLSNNYPNPFNPTTTIDYSVRHAGNVKIDIYNILGQHIYTLVDGYHVPGNLYQVVWNSSNQSNAPISSGVYFYKMIANDFEKQGVMTIVK